MTASTQALLNTRESRTRKAGSFSSQAKKPNLSPPLSSPVEQISYLQRTVGNRQVERLLKSGVMQAKPTIGQAGAKPVLRPQTAAPSSAPVIRAKPKVGEPDDKFEEEANRMAELTGNDNSSILPSAVARSRSPVESLQRLYGNQAVLQRRNDGSGGLPAPSVALGPSQSGILQRKCACGGAAGISGECEECAKKRRLGLRTKLKVNEPGDIYEQEADRIADQVMRMPETQLQRSCACGGGCPRCQAGQSGHEHERFQTKHVGSGGLGQTAVPPIVQEVLAAPGQPLDPATRGFMEPRFGHDFSWVRVHTDARATESAQAINAATYTVGRDIVFNQNHYDPHSAPGRFLLAHELAHTLQQGKAGSMSAVDRAKLQIGAPNDRSEAEADDVAAWLFSPFPITALRIVL
jgi:Domain of unknown function (DUF4157)